MHAFSHVICIYIRIRIRVAAAAEEIVYEVVAEPSKPLEQAQQEERRENQAKAPWTRVLSSRLKASPGAHPTISNYDTYICL